VLKTGRLVVDGRRFRDEIGREVLLRGVNAGGRSKWEPFLPFDLPRPEEFEARLAAYMDRLASWGINVLRLPF
jgi:endoglycosylceramidase